MKRLLKLTLAAIAAIFLIIRVLSEFSGGGAGIDNTSKGSGDTATVHALGERFVLGNFAYEIHGRHIEKIDSSLLPAGQSEPGGVFVSVVFNIENISSVEQTVNTDEFIILDSNGRSFKSFSFYDTMLTQDEKAELKEYARVMQDAADVFGRGQRDSDILPLKSGHQRQQKVAFRVPEEAIMGSLTVEIPQKGLLARAKARVVVQE